MPQIKKTMTTTISVSLALLLTVRAQSTQRELILDLTKHSQRATAPERQPGTSAGASTQSGVIRQPEYALPLAIRISKALAKQQSEPGNIYLRIELQNLSQDSLYVPVSVDGKNSMAPGKTGRFILRFVLKTGKTDQEVSKSDSDEVVAVLYSNSKDKESATKLIHGQKLSLIISVPEGALHAHLGRTLIQIACIEDRVSDDQYTITGHSSPIVSNSLALPGITK